jgi:hypothetical protein
VRDRPKQITLDLAEAETWTIGVIADTHGKPHARLFWCLEQCRPALILHAGDVGSIRLVTELERIGPTVYVRGNIDPRGSAWPDSVALLITVGGSALLNLLLVHNALARLKLNRMALSLLRQSPAQLVVFGHSHVPFLGMDGKVCLFNPGSAGPGRWGLPTTLGLILVSPHQLQFKHLNVATGEEWKPLGQSSTTSSEVLKVSPQ